MEQLSTRLTIVAGEPTHYCPGCDQLHRINVNAPNPVTGAIWHWNHNADRPTFSPSVHIVGRCHYFLSDGELQYLPDCSHELAGQTVALPELPEWAC